MTKEEALALNHLFANVQGYNALCEHIHRRIENIKKELLTAELDEIKGLQKSASELSRLLSLKERAKQALEVNDG